MFVAQAALLEPFWGETLSTIVYVIFHHVSAYNLKFDKNFSYDFGKNF